MVKEVKALRMEDKMALTRVATETKALTMEMAMARVVKRTKTMKV